MKRNIIVLWMIFSITLLIAGGNVTPQISKVKQIPSKMCKENKIYIETDANLMWQDQAYTVSEDGAYKRNHSVAKAGNWKHAINYCRRLNYYGYSDWRLPTADELVHVHRKQGQMFTYFSSDDFWSATSSPDSRYYVVFPADAYRYKRDKRESNYIRCVRCIKEDIKATNSGWRSR